MPARIKLETKHKIQLNSKPPRIGRPAGKKGSRHSVQNQADGEKLATGSNSSKTDPKGYQNRDAPTPDPTEPSSTEKIKSKRYKWTREEHKQILAAYYTALKNPLRNITQQTYDIWRNVTGSDHHPNMDPNKLGSVRRYIEKKFSPLEIEEIKNSINKECNQAATAPHSLPDNEEPINHNTLTPTRVDHIAETENLETCPEIKDHILRELSLSKHLEMESREQLPKIQINRKNLEK